MVKGGAMVFAGLDWKWEKVADKDVLVEGESE